MKIHATFRALERGAEDLLIRMPIKVIIMFASFNVYPLFCRKSIFLVEKKNGIEISLAKSMFVIHLSSLILKFLNSLNTRTISLHPMLKRTELSTIYLTKFQVVMIYVF